MKKSKTKTPAQKRYTKARKEITAAVAIAEAKPLTAEVVQKTIGRPALYKTPEELQAKIDLYFNHETTPRKRQVVVKEGDNFVMQHIPFFTISGLVLFLGFSDRASFYDMEAKPAFSHTIKNARERIALEYEELLQTGNKGAIFGLKNFGWRDDYANQVVEKVGDTHYHFTNVEISRMTDQELTDNLLGRGHVLKRKPSDQA